VTLEEKIEQEEKVLTCSWCDATGSEDEIQDSWEDYYGYDTILPEAICADCFWNSEEDRVVEHVKEKIRTRRGY